MRPRTSPLAGGRQRVLNSTRNRSSSSHRSDYAGRHHGWALVLPYTNYGPSGIHKNLSRLYVALAVSPHLVGPERGIRFCDGVVFWTSVPVAAIDEHSESCAGEDQVGPAVETLQRPSVDSIAESGSVDKPTHGQLGAGVSAAVCLHSAPDTWRRSP
jgi:hypothetical protein